MKPFCQVRTITRIRIGSEIGVYAGSRDFGAVVLVRVIRNGKPVIISAKFEDITELVDHA